MAERLKFVAMDISHQVYGKYMHCTKWKGDGMWYADEDFTHPGGFGRPVRGALPAPHQDTPELIAKAKRLHEEAAQRAIDKVMRVRQPWYRRLISVLWRNLYVD